jgi:outer membrane protein assembly factor BamD (BamD/ComL family)
LTDQNDLYAAAVAARRAGKFGEAVAGYDRLLARYPDGPLAEAATVERLRLLAKTDSTRAKEEAARYLSRYPRGFARSEAAALVGKE